MNFKLSAAIRVVFIVYPLFLLSCSNDSEVKPEGDCRLVRSERRSAPDIKNSASIGNTEAKYSTDGKLLEYISTTISNDNSGNLIKKSETKVLYTYNEEGLLAEENSSYGQVFPSLESLSSSLIQYKYQNGILVEKKIHSISNLVGGKFEAFTVDTYEYDANQNVVKNTYSFIDQGLTGTQQISYVWNNNKIEKINRVNYDGSQSSLEIQTNEKGHVIQYKRAINSENRYEYDIEGNLTKREDWVNGKVTYYEVYVYDSKNVPTKSVDSAMEGHPTYLSNLYGNLRPTRNILKHERIYLDESGNQKDSESTVWSYEYNSAGFPVKSIRTNSYKGVIHTNYYEYNYDGCK